MTVIGLLSAPTNLGLRPPEAHGVPGTSKAPGALREAGLHMRLAARGAVDDGVILAGRYVDDHVPGSRRIRNQEAILDHARRLARRLDRILETGHAPLVLGGDCSLLVGTGLALRRRGRHGVVHIDGHTDFRHPGNDDACASLAGEDLAALVGLHWPAVSGLDGLAPYVDAADVVHIGCRSDDEHLGEVRRILGDTITADDVLRDAGNAAKRAQSVVDRADLAGYWLHVDVDVLDPFYLAAVDSPTPGGLSPDDLVGLLAALAPAALGAQITVFDPDLDPDGTQAKMLGDIIVAGLSDLGSWRA
ncbi:arginase [Nocardioides aurantiacus]|uniref:Arginase n=1 Tax=Nocardioides aurantiacus TaxID=86796 RepID=A0A3N2CU91_9ACTN|nr:arginase [Nocardioides aurantiacus]